MSKKMKGVTLNSAPYSVYEDAKTILKHQSLLQDYQELQKEMEAMRNKVDSMKQKKLTLLAEVRFLRRRYKFLLKNRYPNAPLEREHIQPVQPQNLETQRRKNAKDRVHNKKAATLRNAPPNFDLKQKGRSYTGKEAASQKANQTFDLNQKETLPNAKEASLHNPIRFLDLNKKGRIHRGKEAVIPNPLPIVDLNQLNQRERIYSGTNAALRHTAPLFDLNQDSPLGRKEGASQSRTPIFDLNQISREEEEFQNDFEPMRIEEQRKGYINGGSDEQLNELKLSICRNVGDGSSRVGKRKISWQDPVALRV